MRKLIAAMIVGLTVGLLTSAALACNDDAYTPPPNGPEVHQPPVDGGTN